MTAIAFGRVRPESHPGEPGEPGSRPRPFDRVGLFGRGWPFALVAVLAVAIDAVDFGDHTPGADLAGTALVAVVIASMFLVPWSRLPEAADAIPPVLYIAAVMLIRDSSGGAASGTIALYALPLVWVSLYGDTRSVVLTYIVTVLALVVPILIVGAPKYPPEEWQQVGITGLAAMLLGGTVSVLVNRIRTLVRVGVARSDALALSEARLDAMIQSAHDAIVSFDGSGRIVNANPAAATMFGRPAMEMIGLDAVDSFASVPVRMRMRALLAGIVAGEMAGEGRLFQAEILRIDGSSFPADITLGVSITHGQPIVHAFARDVSDRSRAEAQVRQHTADLDALLATSKLLVDPAHADTLPAEICEAAKRLSGGVMAVLFERRGDDLVVTAAAGATMPAVRMPLHGAPSACSIAFHSELPHLAANVQSDPLADNSLAKEMGVRAGYWQPVRGQAGSAGVLVVCWNEELAAVDHRVETVLNLLAGQAGVALEMAGLLQTLESLARTDGLTGIANRRTFDSALLEEMDRSARSGQPLALIMLDLDHFKRYNDGHGHQAGDRLLVDATARWQRELRPSDLLARYGGEEFVVVLPDASAEAAMRVAARLRESVPDGQTISAGIAAWDRGESSADLIARCDAALYRAKAEGRDRAVIG